MTRSGRIVHDFQQRVGAIGCRVRVAMRRKPLHQQVEDQRIVVDDQDFDVLRVRHCFPRFRERTYDPAPPAGFLHQMQLRDLHAALECFAHVVDRQRRHRRGNQRFHLDAGGPRGRRLRGDLDSILAQLRAHIHVSQGQGVTKRNQLRRALGRGDSGDPRDLERVALRRFQPPHACYRRALHAHERVRHRGARSRRLGGHVHHAHATLFVVMR